MNPQQETLTPLLLAMDRTETWNNKCPPRISFLSVLVVPLGSVAIGEAWRQYGFESRYTTVESVVEISFH